MENLSGAQGFLLLHQHLRHMDWSKITKGVTQPEYLILTSLHVHHQEDPESQGAMSRPWARSFPSRFP